MKVWLTLALLLTQVAGAQTPTKIMYFSAGPEIKLSKAFHSLDLPLPVLRIGVSASGAKQLGTVRFLAVGATRAQCRREAIRLARMAFSQLPHLEQLDLTGDDRDDQSHQKKRPEVLFSSSIQRGELAGLSAALTPGRQLEGVGKVRYAPSLPEDPETAGTVEAALREVFKEAVRRMPIRRHRRISGPAH